MFYRNVHSLPAYLAWFQVSQCLRLRAIRSDQLSSFKRSLSRTLERSTRFHLHLLARPDAPRPQEPSSPTIQHPNGPREALAGRNARYRLHSMCPVLWLPIPASLPSRLVHLRPCRSPNLICALPTEGSSPVLEQYTQHHPLPCIGNVGQDGGAIIGSILALSIYPQNRGTFYPSSP